MRRPEGTCSGCWQQPHDGPCWPFVADERRYGDPDDGPTWTTDKFESFLLDATNPRQDTRNNVHGFQIDQVKTVVAAARKAIADGSLTLADVAGVEAEPQADEAQAEGEPYTCWACGERWGITGIRRGICVTEGCRLHDQEITHPAPASDVPVPTPADEGDAS